MVMKYLRSVRRPTEERRPACEVISSALAHSIDGSLTYPREESDPANFLYRAGQIESRLDNSGKHAGDP